MCLLVCVYVCSMGNGPKVFSTNFPAAAGAKFLADKKEIDCRIQNKEAASSQLSAASSLTITQGQGMCLKTGPSYAVCLYSVVFLSFSYSK